MTEETLLEELDQLTKERPSAEQSSSRELVLAWWEAQAHQVIEKADTFLEAFPDSPREAQVISWLARYCLYLRDHSLRSDKMELAHQLVDKAMSQPTTGDDVWESLASWKFFRLLQEPPERRDVSRIQNVLGTIAERIPQAASRRNLESQYLQLLRVTTPEAVSGRLEILLADPNSAVASLAKGLFSVENLRTTPVDWVLPTLDHGEINLKDLRGQIVLVDFWATWCGPCMAKMPKMKELHAAYGDRGLAVVGVTLDRAADVEKVRETVARLGLDWPHFLDLENQRNQLAESLGITAIPALFLFDRNGLLVRNDLRPSELEAEIQLLLGL